MLLAGNKKLKELFEKNKRKKELKKLFEDVKETSIQMGMGCRYTIYTDGDLSSISFSAKPPKSKEDICVLLEELVRSLRSQDFDTIYPPDSNRLTKSIGTKGVASGMCDNGIPG